MDEIKLQQLYGDNIIEIRRILEDFNKTNANLFNFERLRINEEWHQIWNAVFKILENPSHQMLYPLCLSTVRILSRDELSLRSHDVNAGLNRLLALAQLISDVSGAKQLLLAKEQHEQAQIQQGNSSRIDNEPITCITLHTTETITEALKCLCNLVYQNAECRRRCVKKTDTLNNILKRVISGNNYPYAVELYDMKLLFLLTALDAEARNKMQIDHNGVAYMTELMDEKLCDLKSAPYSEEQLDVFSEMLKVMFNITTSLDKSPNENEIQNLHLTGIIRDIVLHFGLRWFGNERERNIISQCINLLTNISSSCFIELTPRSEKNCSKMNDLCQFEGHNVKVLDIFLEYLQKVLDEQESTAGSGDSIPPILTVLVKCVSGHAFMRHYIRNIILPPLKDVTKRPEVGNELRNRLTRFLTLPSSMLRDLAGDLLFICCKENVGRMIKYTGYGNAAGLFAARGLLDCRRLERTQYSSESEDSDTEEYKKVEHNINPVLGCYEDAKCDPLEGMSEEQKEYEAVKLANLMDQLHRSGVIHPCRVNEDGKPVPVDHILELQQELPEQQNQQRNKN